MRYLILTISLLWGTVVMGQTNVVMSPLSSCVGDTVTITYTGFLSSGQVDSTVVYHLSTSTIITDFFFLDSTTLKVIVPQALSGSTDNISVYQAHINGSFFDVNIATDSVLTVKSTPTVDAVANATYCHNDAGTAIAFTSALGVVGTTYNWTSTADVGFGTSGTGDIAAYTVTNATNAIVTATVTVTPMANACTGTTQNFTITVKPTPTPSFINSFPLNSSCLSTSLQTYIIANYDNTSTYQWSVTNGTITTNNIVTVVVDWNTGIGELTLTETAPNGCSATFSDSVSYNNPIVLLGNNSVNDTVCPNQSVTFIAAGDATSFDFYVDNVSKQSSSSPSFNYAFGNTETGNKTIKVIGTNAVGCTTESTQTVNVQSLPGSMYIFREDTKNMLPDDILINIFDTVIITTYSFGETYDSTKLAFSGPGVLSIGNNYFFNPSLAGIGTHTITYTYSLQNGCNYQSTFTMPVDTISNNLVIGIDPLQRVCIGDILTISPVVTSSLGQPFTEFKLYSTIPPYGYGGAQPFTLIDAATHKYTLNTTSLPAGGYFLDLFYNSPSYSSYIYFYVDALPNPPQSSDTLYYCEGDDVLLSAVGSNLKWYLSSDSVNNELYFDQGDSIVVSNNLLIGDSTSIYVTQRTSDCESPPKEIIVIKRTVPILSNLQIDDSYCINSPVDTIIGINTTNIHIFSGQGLFNGNGNTALFNPALVNVGSQTITYTLIDTTFGCDYNLEIPITINDIPSVNYTGLSSSYCLNADETALTGIAVGGSGTLTGIFSGNGLATLAGVTSFDPTLAGVGSHNITYTATDANLCSNQFTKNTTVLDLPPLPITDTLIDYCDGDPLQLFASGTNIKWYSDYDAKVIIGTGNVLDASNSLNISGDTTVLYVSTQPNVCESFPRAITIIKRQKPTVSLSGVNSSYCINGSIDTLTGITANGTHIFSGIGIGIDTINQATNQAIFNPTTAGVGTEPITYSFTDSIGCTNDFTTSITVNDTTPVNLAGLGSGYCITDNPVALSGFPTGGTFTGTGLDTLSGVTYFDPSVAGAGSHVLTYTYENVNNCFSVIHKQTAVISQSAPPNVTSVFNFCDGDDLKLVLSGNNIKLYSSLADYNNDVSISGIWTGNTLEILPSVLNASSDTTIFYVSDNVGTCKTLPGTITVIKNPKPIVQINGLDSLYCVNELSDIISGSSPSSGVGVFSGNGISTLTDTTFFTPNLAGLGNHTITYTFTDGNGCTSSKAQTIQVENVPDASFTGLQPQYCVNDSNVTALSGSVISTGQFAGQGIGTLGNGDKYFSPTQAGSGIYTITYSVVDSNQCANQSSQSVTVLDVPPTPISNTLIPYCAGDALKLGASGTNVRWYKNLTDYTNDNPVSTGDSIDVVNLNLLSTTNDTTYFYVSSKSTNCESEPLAITVIKYSKTPAVISGLQPSYCLGESPVTITGINSTGTHLFAGQGLFNANGNTVLFESNLAGVGSYNISYTFIDLNGCSSTATENITVHSLPTVDYIGLDTVYCLNGNNQNPLIGTPGGGTFTGSGLDTFSNGNSYFNPSLAGVGSHTITYSYTDGNQCSNDLLKVVEVFNLLPAPITTDLINYCVGDALKITANGTALRWYSSLANYNADNSIFQGDSLQITNSVLSPTSDTTIIYVSDNAGSCTTLPAAITIIKRQKPTVSLSGVNSSYCINGSIDTLTGITANGTHLFSGIGITTINQATNQAIFNPTTAGVGTQSITYSFTDNNGCTNDLTTSITVNDTTPVNLAGLSAGYCITTNPIALSGFPTGGTFTGTGLDTLSGVTYFDPSLAGAGSHVLTYTFTNGNNCTNDISKQTAVISPSAPPSVTSVVDFCDGDGLKLGVAGNNIKWYTSLANYNNDNFILQDDSLDIVGLNLINNTSDTTIIYVSDNVGICKTLPATITVIKNPKPTIQINGLSSLYCINELSDTISGSSTSSGVGVFSGNGISTLTNNAIFTPNLAGLGNHTITYTFTDGNGCTSSKAQTIQVENVPDASFTGLQPQYCVNDSNVTALSGSVISTGQFAGQGIGTLGNGDKYFSPTQAGSGIYTITYSVVDSNQCANQSSQSVTVLDVPPTPISNTLIPYCAGDALKLGASGTNVRWYKNLTDYTNDNPVSTGDSIDVVNLNLLSTTNDTTYFYVSSKSTNCESEPLAITVIKYSKTPAVISGLQPSYCLGENLDTIVGINSTGTHLFAGQGLFNANGNTVLFESNLAGVGSYNISYTFIDLNGCSSTATENITVHSLPTVDYIGLDTVYCLNGNNQNPLIGTPGGGTFTGSGLDTFSNGTSYFNPSLAGVGSHTITYSYTDGNQCSNDLLKVVEVFNLLPAPITTDLINYCVGDALKITANGTALRWYSSLANYNADNSIFQGDSLQITNSVLSPTSDTTIIYVSDNAGSCTTLPAAITIIKRQKPTVSLSGVNSSYCINGSIDTLTGITANGTHLFSGIGITTINQATNQAIFNPTTAGVGTQSITYSFTDNNGCTNDLTTSITVNDTTPVNLAGLSAGYCITTNPIALSGFPTGGTFTGTGLDTLSGVTYFDPSLAGAGSHVLTYTFTNGNNCTNDISKQTAVISPSAPPSVTSVVDFCDGDGLKLGVAGNNIKWYTSLANYNNDNFILQDDSLDIVGLNLINNTSDTTIIYVSDNVGICKTLPATITVIKNPKPTIQINGLSSLYCINELSDTISGSSTSSGVGVFSGNGISTLTNNAIFTPNLAGLGNHTITYTFTDGNGCTSSKAQTIQVENVPDASFTGLQPQYCVNDSNVTALSGSVISTGQFAGQGIGTLGNGDKYFSPTQAGSGIYTITYSVVDSNQCANQSSQSVTVLDVPPTPISNTLIPYCAGDALKLGASGTNVRWYKNLTDYTNDNPVSTGDSIDVVNLNLLSTTNDTTYFYVSSKSTNCESEPLAITVIKYSKTPAVISGLQPSYCLGENLDTIVGINSTGTHLFAGQGLFNANGNTVLFESNLAGVGSYNISYTFIDLNGCSSTATENITVHSLPTVDYIGLDTVYCLNGNNQNPLIGTPGGGTFTGSGLDTFSNGTSYFNPSLAGVGSHTITYSYTDGNQCSNDLLKVVEVFNLLPAPITTDLINYCVGDALKITANGTALRWYSSLANYNADNSIFQGDSLQITNSVLSPTSDTTIIYVSDNAGSCTTLPAAITIIKRQKPTVSLSGVNSSYCINGSIDTLTGITANGTHLFSGIGITTINQATNQAIFNPTTAGVGTQSITYSFTDNNGCTNDLTTSITVNDTTPVNLAGLSAGYCITTNPIALSGFPTGGTFTGTGLDTLSGVTYFDPSLAGAGSHVLTYTFTNGNNCTNDISKQTAVISPSAPPSVTSVVDFCDGDGLKLGVAGNNIKWYTSLANYNNDNFILQDDSLDIVGLNLINNTSDTTIIYVSDNVGICKTLPATITVIKNPKPTIQINGLSSLYCINELSDTISGSSTSSGVGVFSGNGISTLTNNAIFTPNLAGLGNHTITYTFTDGNGCTSSKAQTIQVENVPDASFTGLQPQYCVNDSNVTALSGSVISTGQFAGQGIGTLGNGDKYFSPTQAGSGIYTITYSVVDSNQCANQSSQSVTVLDVPPTPISNTLIPYCAGDALKLGASGTNVRWYKNLTDYTNDNPVSTGDSIDVVNLNLLSTTNDTTYFYVSSKSTNCESEPLAITVIKYSKTPAVISGLQPSYCLGENLDTIVGINSTGTHLFAGQGLFNANGNTVLFESNLAGVGSYNISYTFIDLNGCSSTATENITVHSLPTVDYIGLDTVYCLNGNNQNPLIGTPGGGTFTGSGLDTFSNGNSYFNPSLAGVGSHTITYSYTDGNQCSNDLLKVVEVFNLLPAPITTDLINYCVGDALKITANGTALRWYSSLANYNADNSIFQGDSLQITNSVLSPTSDTTIIYVSDNAGSCTTLPAAITIIKRQKPSPQINGLDSIYCINAVLDSISTNLTAGQGVFSGQGIAPNGNSAYFNPNIAGIGSHIITYTHSDTNGCSAIITKTIEVKDIPNASFLGLQNQYCLNDDNQIPLTGVINTNGVYSGLGIDTLTSGAIVFNPSLAGIGLHTVTYTVVDGNQCTNSVDSTIQVNQVPNSSFLASDTTFCENEPMSLLIPSISGGVFASNSNGVSNSNNAFSPSIAGSGVHDITYALTANGCTSIDTISVTVEAAPSIGFTTQEVCVGLPIQFTDTSSIDTSASIDTWFWLLGDGTIDSVQNPNHIYNQTGIFEVELTAFADNGCFATLKKSIDVDDSPDIDFSWSNNCEGDMVNFIGVLNNTGNLTISNWSWDFGNSQIDSVQSPLHTYGDTGVYTVNLIATSTSGCLDTATKQLFVLPYYDLTNSFYRNDFENDNGGWIASFNTDSTNKDNWEYGTPSANTINSAASGTKVWSIDLDSTYESGRNYIINSPCFDFSNMRRPMISLDIWYDSRQGLDGAIIQYQTNNNPNWIRLGDMSGDGINWYNFDQVVANPGNQPTGQFAWSGQSNGWVNARHPLDHLKGESVVRFRIVFSSTAGIIADDGFAFDNVFIGDRDKILLLEYFSDLTQSNIGLINDSIYQRVNKFEDDIVLLEYHLNDNINAQNFIDPNARALYYNLSTSNFTPKSVLDGNAYKGDAFTNGSLPWTEELLNRRMLRPSYFNIDINSYSFTVNNGELNLGFKVAPNVALPQSIIDAINADEVVIQIAVVEDSINVNGAILRNVLRQLIPDPAGVVLNTTGNKNITQSWTSNSNIQNISNLDVVIFIQNNITKEVYHARSKNLPFPVSTQRVLEEEPNFIVYPNPTSGLINLEFEKSINASVSWNLYNAQGVRVNNGKFAQGIRKTQINNESISNGIYLLELRAEGQILATRKILIMR